MSPGHTFTVTVRTGPFGSLADTSVVAQQTSATGADFSDLSNWVFVEAGDWVSLKGVTNDTSTPGNTLCTFGVAT